MDIATPEQHRALAFIAACEAHGYHPTGAELEKWIEAPGRRPRDPFRMATTLRNDLERMAFGPPEAIHETLSRLGWIARDQSGGNSRIGLTPLGRALLAHAETTPEPRDEVLEVVLNSNDALAYPQLIGRLAGLGEGLLVDAYLGLQQLIDCVSSTRIRRYLVSDAGGGRAQSNAAMATWLSGRQLEIADNGDDQDALATIELRASNELHDRLVVPDSRDIHTLGTSLNGVGRKKITTFAPAADAAQDALRAAYADIWKRATTLYPPSLSGEPPAGLVTSQTDDRDSPNT